MNVTPLVSVPFSRWAGLKDTCGQQAASAIQHLTEPCRKGASGLTTYFLPQVLLQTIPSVLLTTTQTRLTNKGWKTQQQQCGDHGDVSPQLSQETWKHSGLQNMKKLLLIFNSTLEKLTCQKLPPWGTRQGWHQLKKGWAIEVLSPDWGDCNQGGPCWQPGLAGACFSPCKCHCLLTRPLLKAHSVSLWWAGPLALL